ncbi:hypothetical protein THAOC_21746 [Thalassiosira oceanica]|uniref:Uncharacterized protein n=1 Tax=Thalassiosira oceanica TaxID=159749 RepID=K0SI28_THAOC|nr:hypothetical protein THAOC_21746 [Thalassiosira oceanica]|eukprot:EJK58152.1 hypothetical protein THAOC_21746 [Thalassiosira oceanica]
MKWVLLLTTILPLSACGASSTFRPQGSGYLKAPLSHSRQSNYSYETKGFESGFEAPSLVEVSRGGEASVSNVDVPTGSELAGAAFFTALQVVLNKVLKANGIAFPAMLGCTILVFAALVFAEVVSPGAGEHAFQLLTPGSNFIADHSSRPNFVAVQVASGDVCTRSGNVTFGPINWVNGRCSKSLISRCIG